MGPANARAILAELKAWHAEVDVPHSGAPSSHDLVAIWARSLRHLHLGPALVMGGSRCPRFGMDFHVSLALHEWLFANQKLLQPRKTPLAAGTAPLAAGAAPEPDPYHALAGRPWNTMLLTAEAIHEQVGDTRHVHKPGQRHRQFASVEPEEQKGDDSQKRPEGSKEHADDGEEDEHNSDVGSESGHEGKGQDERDGKIEGGDAGGGDHASRDVAGSTEDQPWTPATPWPCIANITLLVARRNRKWCIMHIGMTLIERNVKLPEWVDPLKTLVESDRCRRMVLALRAQIAPRALDDSLLAKFTVRAPAGAKMLELDNVTIVMPDGTRPLSIDEAVDGLLVQHGWAPVYASANTDAPQKDKMRHCMAVRGGWSPDAETAFSAAPDLLVRPTSDAKAGVGSGFELVAHRISGVCDSRKFQLINSRATEVGGVRPATLETKGDGAPQAWAVEFGDPDAIRQCLFHLTTFKTTPAEFGADFTLDAWPPIAICAADPRVPNPLDRLMSDALNLLGIWIRAAALSDRRRRLKFQWCIPYGVSLVLSSWTLDCGLVVDLSGRSGGSVKARWPNRDSVMFGNRQMTGLEYDRGQCVFYLANGNHRRATIYDVARLVDACVAQLAQ